MARSASKFDESSKVWCIVTQPDSVCFSFKLKEDAKGQDLLDAVCERLGIVEKDYFGLQYTNRGEILWLNMRNRISRQVPKPEPFSLLFCVKFYVQPHQILQESTRHQFFLNVKRDFESGKYRLERNQSVRIQALIAQALSGDFRENHIAYNPPRSSEWPAEYRSEVIMEHCRLRGMPTKSAEYQFLSEMARVEEYGMEHHTSVKSEDNRSVVVGVGTESIKIHRILDNLMEKVPYACLRMATHSGKCVKLDIYTNEMGGIDTVTYRLNSKDAACALYRSITEHHAFYRCDSIRPAVKTQVSKDLFDTFRSWFYDENSAEQNYIFDTERTCREAYDHARRVLYNFGSVAAVALEKSENTEQKDEAENAVDLKEKYDSLQDSFRCRVCRDNAINSVVQCGHMVCCSDCIKLCSSCPICRTPIETLTPVYLPVELDFGSD